MEHNIVQIDLGKIDAEIFELRQKIDLLLNMKKYAESISIKPSVQLQIPVQGHPYKPDMGVSEYIMEHLKRYPRSETKSIISGFAAYLGKPYDKVNGNVSNALSRLKTDKKIMNEEKPGGRKAGSVWFLIG